MNILIVNGPNLNLIGTREPEIYGQESLDEYLSSLDQLFPEAAIELFQSNIEGEIVDCLQGAGNYDGVILNAGGYTHTSVAIADAVGAIDVHVIEVHISNIHRREQERQTSLLSKHCNGSIIGLGIKGYELAIEVLLDSANPG